MSRADCADLADAAPRSSTSFTTSRKPLNPSLEIGEVRAFNTGSARFVASPAAVYRRHLHRFASLTAAVRRAAVPAVRFRTCADGTLPNAGLGRSRRGGTGARRSRRSRGGRDRTRRHRWALGACLADASPSTFRIASSSARRSLGDVRFRERRFDRTQLRDQRGTRPFVQRPTSFAGALVKALYGAGDKRMIVGHCPKFTLGSLKFHLQLQTDFASGWCPRAPGWSTERRRSSRSVPRCGAHI